MGCPRITIGDGSVYIQAEGITSWQFSDNLILSPHPQAESHHICVTVWAGKELLYKTTETVERLEIALEEKATWKRSLRTEPQSIILYQIAGGRVQIELIGVSGFSSEKWRSMGDNLIFFDVPNLHLKSVRINGERPVAGQALRVEVAVMAERSSDGDPSKPPRHAMAGA